MSFWSKDKTLTSQLIKENNIQSGIAKNTQKIEHKNNNITSSIKKTEIKTEKVTKKQIEKYKKYDDVLNVFYNSFDKKSEKPKSSKIEDVIDFIDTKDKANKFLQIFQDYIKSQLESGKTSKDLQPILKDFRSTLNDFVSSWLLSQKDFSEYKTWLEWTERNQNITTKETPEKNGIKLDWDFDKIDDNKYLEIKNGVQSVVEKWENGTKDKKEISYADWCLSITIEWNYCKEDTTSLEKQLKDITNLPKRKEEEIVKDINYLNIDKQKILELKKSWKKLQDYTKDEQQLVAKYIDKNNLANLKKPEEIFVEVEKNLQIKEDMLIQEKEDWTNLLTKKQELTSKIEKIKNKNEQTDKEKSNLTNLENFSQKLLKSFYESGYSKLFESGDQMKKIISEISSNREVSGQDKLKIATFLKNPTQVPELNDSQFKEEMNIIKDWIKTIMWEWSEVFFGNNWFVWESVNLNPKSLKEYANKNPDVKLLDDKWNPLSEKLTKDIFKRVFVWKWVLDKTWTVSEMWINRVLAQKSLKNMIDIEFPNTTNLLKARWNTETTKKI